MFQGIARSLMMSDREIPPLAILSGRVLNKYPSKVQNCRYFPASWQRCKEASEAAARIGDIVTCPTGRVPARVADCQPYRKAGPRATYLSHRVPDRTIAPVREGKPAEQTAVELGIHPFTSSKWLRQDDVGQGPRPGKPLGRTPLDPSDAVAAQMVDRTHPRGPCRFSRDPRLPQDPQRAGNGDTEPPAGAGRDRSRRTRKSFHLMGFGETFDRPAFWRRSAHRR